LLGHSSDAVERLTRLTGDLIDASRGTAPQLDRSVQDLRALVAQAIDWSAEPTAAKGVVLVHEEPDRDARVVGDADAILSIAGNLLSNAIRYTPSGGRVTVRHGSHERESWFEVRDTGIGMDPSVQARVWEKFYRAPEAHRHSSQGLGLGLTLVRRLVEAHRGRVELESAPGRG